MQAKKPRHLAPLAPDLRRRVSARIAGRRAASFTTTTGLSPKVVRGAIKGKPVTKTVGGYLALLCPPKLV